MRSILSVVLSNPILLERSMENPTPKFMTWETGFEKSDVVMKSHYFPSNG